MQISYNLKKCSKTTWPGVAKLKRLRLLAQGTRRRGTRESGRESAASRRRPFPARTGGSAGPVRGSASLRTSGSFRGSSDADRCEELRISYSMRRGLRDVHSFAPLHSQQFRTCSSKCVLIFLRTFGAGGPRRWSPRRSSPSSRAACGRASRAREKRKIPCPSSRTALSNVKQKCPIWIKCRLTTYLHRVDLLRSFRPNAANLHLQRTLLFEEAGQKKR